MRNDSNLLWHAIFEIHQTFSGPIDETLVKQSLTLVVRHDPVVFHGIFDLFVCEALSSQVDQYGALECLSCRIFIKVKVAFFTDDPIPQWKNNGIGGEIPCRTAGTFVEHLGQAGSFRVHGEKLAFVALFGSVDSLIYPKRLARFGMGPLKRTPNGFVVPASEGEIDRFKPKRLFP